MGKSVTGVAQSVVQVLRPWSCPPSRCRLFGSQGDHWVDI